jgi:oxygen-independent coproporphyrinogen-3 oxidase
VPVDVTLARIAWYNPDVQRQGGIYIHIPFCERKCTYCNFNTTDFFADLAGRYIEAVTHEIVFWGENLRPPSGDLTQIDTIYFGGGTPSLIDPELLAGVLVACRTAFDVASYAEVTIEVNPTTLSRKKVDQWLSAGINRASIGVQSFIDDELVSLSRTHSADEARRTIEVLRESGFENISLDLIAGLPGQSLRDWEFNLREALAIRPEHLSLYMLDLKEGTQLLAQLKRGFRPPVDDDLAAEMYRMISAATLAAGYEHYEISNFARVERVGRDGISFFRSKHNCKYWTGAPFYGIGCGAHSYDRSSRWFNVLRTETYIDRITTGGDAIAERKELSESDRAADALFMGLRLKEGISLSAFRSEYGIDVIERFGEELPRLADAGLIELAGGQLTLTPAGRLLSNEVFVSFV